MTAMRDRPDVAAGEDPGTDAAAPGPICILPGCRNSVSEQGMPCDECAAAFGSHLRSTDGPPMTAEAQATRDSETQTTYAVLFAGGDPAFVEAAGGRRRSTPNALRERKANQRCWMCEQRRTCTKQANGWECDACLEIR